jgi:hypothetical protein
VKNIPTRPDSIFLAAVLIISLGLTSNVAAQQALLPNLTALPAFDISAGLGADGQPELRFAFRSWNSGLGPLELYAGEIAQGRQSVYQRVYNDDDTYSDTLAGNFEWHQGHNHFHFDDYAFYELPGGKGNAQRSSAKTSFCLMDTAAQDLSLPGAPSAPVYTSCGNFFQGMSVGFGDTYGSHLSGQEISLKKVKDNDYRLITTVDPQDRLLETDETDNESCVLLRIVASTSTPTVEILDANGCDGGSEPPPPGGDVTVASIEPGSAAKGTSVSVVITGTGFTAGMGVTLENGSGSRPTVSGVGVDVQNSTITALITVKKGAKAGFWDVRVGSGVLFDGFEVTVPGR